MNKTPCIIWMGKTWSNGRYGVTKKDGLSKSVHRLACEAKHGKPPLGALACHTCDNTLCINPDHLYWGTYKSNYQDSIHKMPKPVYQWGEDNPNSKYGDQIIIKCVSLREQGFSYGDIAKKLNIKSKGHVRQAIINFKKRPIKGVI